MLTLKFQTSRDDPDTCNAVIELPCGGRAVVRVDLVDRNGVRLGFEFPDEYKIRRASQADAAGLAVIDGINRRVAAKGERVTAL